MLARKLPSGFFMQPVAESLVFGADRILPKDHKEVDRRFSSNHGHTGAYGSDFLQVSPGVLADLTLLTGPHSCLTAQKRP